MTIAWFAVDTPELEKTSKIRKMGGGGRGYLAMESHEYSSLSSLCDLFYNYFPRTSIATRFCAPSSVYTGPKCCDPVQNK